MYGSGERMKFPTIEELYDMDLEQLLIIKENIENGNIEDKNINLDEEDYDYYDNEEMTKETMLQFVNSEIKERNLMNDVLNFFLKAPIDNEEKILVEEKKEEKRLNKFLENNSILNKEKTNNQLFNFENKDKPIIPKPNEKIGDLLNRTKIKPEDFQYVVSSSTLMKTFDFYNRAKKKKKEKLEPIVDKKPSYINYLPMVKKKRKRKKKKNDDEFVDVKNNNPLELMRKYEVPDVKKFIKKKTLKPIDKKMVSNNLENMNKNNNNNIINKLNNDIKELGQENINVKEKNKINEDKNKIIEITCSNGFNIINTNKINDDFQIQKSSLEFVKGERPISKYDSFSVISGKTQTYKNPDFNFLLIDHCNKINVISECNNSKKDEINKKEDNQIKEDNVNKEIINLDNQEEDITQKICKEIKKNYQENKIEENEDIDLSIKENNISSTTKNSSKINNNNNINNQDKKENKTYQKKEEEVYEYENEENENEEDEIEDDETNIIKTNNNQIYGYHSFSESQSNKSNKNEQLKINKIKKSKDLIDASVSNKKNKNNITNNFRNQNQSKNIKLIRDTIYNSIHNPKLLSPQSKKIQKKINDSLPEKKEEEKKTKRLKSANPSTTRIKTSNTEKKPDTKLNNNNINKNIINSHRPQSNYFQNKSNTPNNNNLFISSQLQLNQENIVDYSDIYHNFNELFSGYFLSSTYSQAKEFNFDQTIQILYESFKNLFYYESNTSLIQQKDEMYADIVRAEAGVIQNRLKNVSSKLLNEPDIDSNIQKYILLRQCLDLEKKNYARSPNQYYNNNDKNKLFFRVVLSRPEIYDIVCYTLYHYSEWSELPHGLSLGQCWNLLWTYGSPNIDFNKIFSFQKVNHLINSRTVHRKDLLQKQINRVRKLNKKLNDVFDIMPQTFLLSKEYMSFIEEFSRIKKTNEYNIWIVKPVGKSRGKGIFLIDEMSEVPLSESYLVQRYLTNPLLLDEGYKFDMRIYILITSTNPLEMFLYKDGFARVSNELFSLDIKNIRTHLTNAAIQNRRANQKNYEKLYGGSKISLDLLKYKLEKQYNIDFDELIWPQVKDLIIKAFVACQHDIPYCPSTFEMFGFDVIIDDNFKCWLLEINSSPSLERSNVLDDQIKLPLVDDIFKIVDPININRAALIKMIERIMKINNKRRNVKGVYLYSQKVQLNMDLTEIFYGKIPRKYGEIPKDIGKFEMICPSKESEKLIKMTGGQKWYNGKRDKEEKKDAIIK